MRFTKVITKDGSETLHDARVGESYKSGHAAATESHVVFLKPGVIDHPKLDRCQPFRILELGFGLGMNFDVLYRWWKNNPAQTIEFTSVDSDLSGIKFLSESKKLCTHITALSSTRSFREQNFQATLLETDFLDALKSLQSATQFHTIFFDPFSPKSEPNSWSPLIFQAIQAILQPQGRLVTYSVSRTAKDALTKAGFSWEKRKLPEILNKRDSLLAIRH